MSLNLVSLIDNSCRLFPDAVALIHDERRLSYRELRRNVGAVAAHLAKLGVRPGDRVALFLPNRMSFTVAYFGILQAGGVVVPISYLSVGREVSYALRDSGACLLIAWSAFEAAAREGVRGAMAQGPAAGPGILLVDESRGPLTVVDGPPIDSGSWLEEFQSNPDDTAVILYTSGTTGEPKGAELTHFNLFSNAQYCSERLLWRPGQAEFLGPGHVGLAALPLFHSFGQTCIQNASLLGGAAVSYLERFEPQAALRVMTRDRVTMFAGVPTMYFQLLRSAGADGHDLSALRFCNSGGAAMPVEVMREFDARFGVNVLEGYGLSETSPVATFNVLWRPKKVGSIGLPILGVDVRVFDPDDRELPTGEVGELVIRGYNVCKGYWRRPEATREAMRRGWFHTGDLGRKDQDGYLFIVDRKKDMIIRGGFNVYPREVEEVLYAHPAVAEAAVVGVPNEEYGEEVKAYLSLKAGMGVVPAEVVAFCRERLGGHKYPRLVEILPSLPKGPTGKILRKELRARR
jgi:long-chain acyl-CoA synthetase